MRFTSIIRNATGHVHTPSIHFLGKRTIPSHHAKPAPHPAAPPEARKTFEAVSNEPSARPAHGAGKSSGASASLNFWDVPPRFWRSKLAIEEREIDAVSSGGATLVQ